MVGEFKSFCVTSFKTKWNRSSRCIHCANICYSGTVDGGLVRSLRLDSCHMRLVMCLYVLFSDEMFFLKCESASVQLLRLFSTKPLPTLTLFTKVINCSDAAWHYRSPHVTNKQSDWSLGIIYRTPVLCVTKPKRHWNHLNTEWV